MGLSAGYGVLIGTKQGFFRDPPDNFGRYYHGNLIVHAPAGNYRCAIDVDPKAMRDGIEWRVVRIRAADFAAVSALSNGWHSLASTPSSGAIDYLRSALLFPPILFRLVKSGSWLARLLHFIRWHPPWHRGTGIQALANLEAVIAQGVRFYVFGEPFTTGLGVHNIHQNQGDPIGGGHDAENGIWQDGGTFAETATGDVIGFLNKFKTQSFKTDTSGRPL